MNELYIAFIAVIELVCLAFASLLGREYLYGSIVANLILVSVLGAKLVTLFGLTTNVGNVFYAAVFVATYILIEEAGPRAGSLAIGIGVAGTALFVVMGQLTLAITSPAD